MDEDSLDWDDLIDRRPDGGRCSSCGGQPQWEQVDDEFGERWLSVCRCGRMQAFLPDQPGLEVDDPLAVFLGGANRVPWPASPPWIRLFVFSQRELLTNWCYHPSACGACATPTLFWLQACPRPFWLATCSLCLACGRVTSQYSQPWKNQGELALTGTAWTPPCPAVQRLRDCVLRPYAPPTE